MQGKRFDWDGGQFRIFQGPPTSELEDYTPALNPSAYWMGGSLTEVTHHYVKGPPGGSVELPQETATGNAVFLVHGANDARREEVARFLERLLGEETSVLVLHEQPQRGRTLIEKFEETAAAAGFAVVLLTGDDVARPAGSEQPKLRARQNVVFELVSSSASLAADE